MEEQKRLFMAAYDAHNQLMDDAMNGQGIDRHLYGLQKALKIVRTESNTPVSQPAIFNDEAYKISGGDGNFLLSTSFIGYMGENDELGSFGYVTAMRPDGYGAFYRIGKDRNTRGGPTNSYVNEIATKTRDYRERDPTSELQVTIADWTGSESNLDVYGDNIVWSLTKLASLFTYKANI